MISPSSASFTSVSGIGGPTVPTRIRPGGLSVAIALVSDIPQVSQISIPIARKNSSTSGGVGAAPIRNDSTSSRPSSERIFEKTFASASSHSACSSSGIESRPPPSM